MVRPVKILHLATFDTHGGAAVAAIRLVDGLRRRGHDARLLVRDKATSHPFVEALSGAGGATPPQTDPAIVQTAWLLSQRARSSKSDAPFSIDLPTYAVADLPIVRDSDVLHLHWVAGFLSSYEIRRLQNLGKPIVWTLHDQFPFTGGCHYAHGCRGFVSRCERCPQLQPAARPLASLTLAQKRDFIDPARLVLAAPSRWLADCARASALFGRARVEVVPYGIDVDARQQVSREAARAALDLAPDALVIFASSVNNAETRKGQAHLVEALRSIRTRRMLGSSGLASRLVLLTAGEGAPDGRVEEIPCRSLGSLAADDPRVAMAYRAADVFVLPSLEDNLPNTLLEAMAAGLPVVAYRTGGIPDFLKDGVNGRLVRRGDAAALSRALADLLVDADRRRRMGIAAADTARRAFDLPIQSVAFERIYEAERRRRARPARSRKPLKKVPPLADVPRLRRLIDSPQVAGLVSTLLRATVDELQQVVAARGGEIRDWRQAVDRADLRALEFQEVIAARGGEIRDLRRDLESMRQALAGTERALAAAGERRQKWAVRLIDTQQAPKNGDRRVGIFGVGEGGRKVLEAILLLDCRLEWLSDNNPKAHGRTRGGLDVIAPHRIPLSTVDVVVIASAHRDAIRAQLLAMGIAPERVVTPDVSQPEAVLLEELRRLIDH
jgi:glycosyltransferase involved in cell wall biosynthesis